MAGKWKRYASNPRFQGRKGIENHQIDLYFEWSRHCLVSPTCDMIGHLSIHKFSGMEVEFFSFVSSFLKEILNVPQRLLLPTFIKKEANDRSSSASPLPMIKG